MQSPESVQFSCSYPGILDPFSRNSTYQIFLLGKTEEMKVYQNIQEIKLEVPFINSFSYPGFYYTVYPYLLVYCIPDTYCIVLCW